MILHPDKVDAIIVCAIYAVMKSKDIAANTETYRFSDNWPMAKEDESIVIVAHGDEFSAGSLTADQLFVHLRNILPVKYHGTIKIMSCLSGRYMSDNKSIASNLFNKLKSDQFKGFSIIAPKGPLMAYVDPFGKVSQIVLNPDREFDCHDIDNKEVVKQANEQLERINDKLDINICQRIHELVSPSLNEIGEIFIKADIAFRNNCFLVLKLL